MAYTKTIPIHTTLNKVFDYICNPDKTDDKLLVSSFGCSPETADIEFKFTANKALDIDKNKIIARHMIQSFSPSDNLTPEQAHGIGKQLADEVLKGQYEYVISTHIDKGHIHNHIVFNAVNFQTKKRYRSTYKTPYDIRRISDKLCKENGLHVIDDPKRNSHLYMRKKYANSKESNKSKIQKSIEHCIKQSDNLEQFMYHLNLLGVEVKEDVNFSFKLRGQKNFTSIKTLGTKYTKEQIIKRITTSKDSNNLFKNNINLKEFIDLKTAEVKGIGYQKWAKKHNLKLAAKTYNQLSTYGISSYNNLLTEIDSSSLEFSNIEGSLKSIENRLSKLGLIIKNNDTYYETKLVSDLYLKTKNSSYLQGYKINQSIRRQIKKPLKHDEINQMKLMYNNLAGEQQELYNTYKILKKKNKELRIIKQNLDKILDLPKEIRRDKEKTL